MTNTTAALRDRLLRADPGIVDYFPHLPTCDRRSLVLVAAQKAQQWAVEGTDPAELAAIVTELEQPEPAAEQADQHTDEQLVAAITAERAEVARHQQAADQHTDTRDQLIRAAMTRRIRRTEIAAAAGLAESRLYQIAKEGTTMQDATATTEIGTWATLGPSSSTVTIQGTVADAVGEFAADYDIDAIITDYRDAINAAMPEGVSLHGQDYIVGPYRREGWTDEELAEVREAIASVDLWEIVGRHDKTAA